MLYVYKKEVNWPFNNNIKTKIKSMYHLQVSQIVYKCKLLNNYY